MTGIEPVTSSLPRKRSTPELHRLVNQPNETQKMKHRILKFNTSKVLERETRFELATLSLEG